MKELINKVKELSKNQKNVYIYGAGSRGQDLYKIFLENDIKIQGFIITNLIQTDISVMELPVFGVETINFDESIIVIGANRRNTIEIIEGLKEKQKSILNVICACEYIEKRNLYSDYYTKPTIEITTVIGCKVNCKYCPQNLLLKNYFKDNMHRDVKMSMETYVTCLKNLPNQCNIKFCGMAEPFLNPLCTDMICEAYQQGKSIELYTTLVGLDKEGLKKIWDIPMETVVIHVPDERGYAKIPITDEYLEILTMALNHKKQDGTPFVNMCNAQTNPPDEIKEICMKAGYEVLTTMNDRAGNLADDELVSKYNLEGKLVCTACGVNLNQNVLLPDGTLLLCCMDYGMKHNLGNLFHKNYGEIMDSDIVKNIKAAMLGDETADILCRQCTYANIFK